MARAQSGQLLGRHLSEQNKGLQSPFLKGDAMKVKATRPVWVKPANEDKKRLLNKNESVDVDGRKYRDHAFIKAGYLVEQADRSAPTEQPKRGRKVKPVADSHADPVVEQQESTEE